MGSYDGRDDLQKDLQLSGKIRNKSSDPIFSKTWAGANNVSNCGFRPF